MNTVQGHNSSYEKSHYSVIKIPWRSESCIKLRIAITHENLGNLLTRDKSPARDVVLLIYAVREYSNKSETLIVWSRHSA